MSRTSTRRPHDESAPADRGPRGSERLLLVAIVLIGVVGLAVSYGGRSGASAADGPTAADTVTSGGRLRGDHMILHRDRRGEGAAAERSVTRF